jgi:signal peptidase I
MERTLFPNDYVLVNKITYGTKVPKRIQEIPVLGGFFKEKGNLYEFNLYKALRPFKPYKQEDIVVFKSTEENNIFLIKRIIGMPGDTLKIENAKVFTNGNILKEREIYCYNYGDSTKKEGLKTFSNKEFNALGYNEKKAFKKDIKVLASKKRRNNLFPYPLANQKKWTRDNYGEIVIPKKGMTIILNDDNFDLYRTLIYNFENQDLELKSGEQLEYTFLKNYYFMMGDNRHGSLDSRSFGFVPESYIQGKMIMPFSKKRFFN